MKTITMTEFRSEPGERVRDVSRHGKSFQITKAGKPVALLLPVDCDGDDVTIQSDGAVRGPLSAGFFGTLAAIRGEGGY